MRWSGSDLYRAEGTFYEVIVFALQTGVDPGFRESVCVWGGGGGAWICMFNAKRRSFRHVHDVVFLVREFRVH